MSDLDPGPFTREPTVYKPSLAALQGCFPRCKNREQNVFKLTEVDLGDLQASLRTLSVSFARSPIPQRVEKYRFGVPRAVGRRVQSGVWRDGKGPGSEPRARGAAGPEMRDTAVPRSPMSSILRANVGRSGEHRGRLSPKLSRRGKSRLATRRPLRPSPPLLSPFRASSGLSLGSRFPRLK